MYNRNATQNIFYPITNHFFGLFFICRLLLIEIQNFDSKTDAPSNEKSFWYYSLYVCQCVLSGLSHLLVLITQNICWILLTHVHWEEKTKIQAQSQPKSLIRCCLSWRTKHCKVVFTVDKAHWPKFFWLVSLSINIYILFFS